MYKAIVTIVSLLGSIGVFVGIELLDSPRVSDRAPSIGAVDMRPPPLEPPVSLDFGDSQLTGIQVIEVDEVRATRRPAKSAEPAATTPRRELQPCSEWEDVGPKALKNPDGTVEMRRARLLC